MSRTARIAWLVVGGGLLALGAMLSWDWPHIRGLGPLLLGLVIVASVVFEGRYRGDEAMPGAGWAPTAEIFKDDESGGWLRVWQHRRSGARRYLPCEGPVEG